MFPAAARLYSVTVSHESAGIEAKLRSERFERLGLIRLEHGRKKPVNRFCVHDAVSNLSRLAGDQRSPDRVALGPDVFAFVVKSPRVPVHHDAERDDVEPRHDAAVKFRRARIDGNRMKTFRIADGLRPVFHQRGEQRAVIVRRAANNKIVGRVAPMPLQPFDIRFVAAGRNDHGARANQLSPIFVFEPHRLEPIVLDDQIFHQRVVAHVNSHARRRQVIRVQQRLAASEKPAIRSPQMQRARERLLPVHPVRAHPSGKRARFANGQLGEIEIRGPARHADQILQMFLFGVRPGKKLVGGGVRAADIARVPRVPAAHMLRRALEHQHAAPRFARRERRAQRRVPASHHDDVVVLRHVSQLAEKLKFLSFRAPTRSGRGISLFLRLNQREIPHFVRNDETNCYFRSLISQEISSYD